MSEATGQKKAVRVKLTADEQVEALQKKIQQVRQRDELKKARELKAATKGSSAQETRRKILVGAFILNCYQDPKQIATKDKKFVDSLIRDDDRALFGLAPLPKSETQNVG